jgi:hypothetical protein
MLEATMNPTPRLPLDTLSPSRYTELMIRFGGKAKA